MRTFLFALGILALASPAANAGRNRYGAMIVHTNDSYDYSAGGACAAVEGDPGTCENANTMATRNAGQVVWLLAAFPPSADPCVAVVYFGIDYDAANLDPGVGYEFCGPPGSIEIADPDWPYGGRGNSVAFGSPICHEILFPFYVFEIDGGVAGTSFFRTTINPTGGYGAFVDDGGPPVMDLCYNYGTIRWGEPGQNSCPDVPPSEGACCFVDGSCSFLPPADCQFAGGTYMGDGEACEPNPCPQAGACCFEDGHCELVLPADCQGTFYGGVCYPNPCPQPPVLGACCFPDGQCEYLPEESCGTGLFFPDVPCEPNPCPPPVYGACCFLDGHCEHLLQQSCGTGVFYPDVPCEPNPCPPPVYGACCYPDGHCEYLSQQACQTGVFHPNTPCEPNPCLGGCRSQGDRASVPPEAARGARTETPIVYSPRSGSPHPIGGTRDICWSQPPDLNDVKLSSEIISMYGLESQVANDFVIPMSTMINRVIAYGGMYNWAPGDPDITAFNLYWFDDDLCCPGNEFMSHLHIAPTRTFIGYDGFGYPTYKLDYWVNVSVTGGTRYWLCVQADDHAFPPQWGSQGTGGIVTECDTMFRSAFFGYPQWTPAADLIGAPYDAAHEFECGMAVAVERTTWGAIKALFR